MAARVGRQDRWSGRRRRVAIVTGSRAEFGLLPPVLRALAGRSGLEPRLIVTGMHLLPKFGRTIDQIRGAGWRIDATVKMQSGRDDPAGEAPAVARGIEGMARALKRLDAQIVVVLGDRIEAFAGACAAVLTRRVLAHVHGGDRAPGDIDEALRNAITRLAHVHFVASQDAADRLRRMGEPPWRIHRVGAPGLDGIRLLQEADRRSPRAVERRLATLLGPLADTPYAVIVQHPRGQPPRAEQAVMNNILGAIERSGLGGVVIYPNSDPGHQGIIRAIGGLRTKPPRWRVFRSLAREDYLRVASRSAVLVGNSSSGIIESASLGVCAVNVGPRQQGRQRCGPGVIDAGENRAAITRAIRAALDRPRPRPGRSVYGDGHAAERMATILRGLTMRPALLQKHLSY